LSCAGKRSHRHTILHVSFSNSFGLASAQPSTGFVGCALSSPKLCIMADATYWCKWENKVEKVKLQHPDEVKCFAIDIDSNIFANQRAVNGGELYTPSLVENHWHSLYTYSY
ncbi:hypothetical protein ACTQ2R_13680, partial [Hallella faecis]|uniref:hypothetical protein n=1 Tax=Hallella faecis TaxID=2841596 RepID=UPI003F91B6AE